MEQINKSVSNKNKIDISVIIVNYNTKQLTLECINSVFEKTIDVLFEVILVDNASTDGSIDFFSNDSRITFIETGSNLGFGGANNIGYSKSIGKYVFLLNSDTLLINNALKCFFDKMELLPKNIGCIGSILRDTQMNPVFSYGRFPKWYDEFLIFKNKKKIETTNNDSLIVDYISGADLFIRRSVIEELGLFDSNFFLYYEETDLQYRYLKGGYRSMIIQDPLIYHLECASTQKTSFSRKMFVTRSYLLYFKKRLPKFGYFCFRVAVFTKRFPTFITSRSLQYFYLLISKV